MKSGLEGRNNGKPVVQGNTERRVSMKSGLEGRNNPHQAAPRCRPGPRLNEVRPRRPEQSTESLVGEPSGGRSQ